jgi:Beta/Gamma crystallin
MAEIIIFVDTDFGGLHTHLYDSISDLNQLPTLGEDTLSPKSSRSWANMISSFRILSGTWRFFTESDFKNQMGNDLGPGDYNWVEDWGIDNDRIQSIMLVEG